MRLYHGSNVAIGRPLVALNAGFSDLGQGFYCTDDAGVAAGRARSRARREGAGDGVVSAFEFDEGALPWVIVGADGAGVLGAAGADAAVTAGPGTGGAGGAGEAGPGAANAGAPFGLRFEPSHEGIAAWATYIRACRQGSTAVEGLGEPAVVRAWIATEEVEMVCSGLLSAEELADATDPAELVVQYCFRDQRLLDALVTPA